MSYLKYGIHTSTLCWSSRASFIGAAIINLVKINAKSRVDKFKFTSMVSAIVCSLQVRVSLDALHVAYLGLVSEGLISWKFLRPMGSHLQCCLNISIYTKEELR